MKPQFSQKQSLSSYIVQLQQKGSYCFSKALAIQGTQTNDFSFKMAVSRLIKNKKVARIKRDFFVIVPPEYYHLGALPAEWFIDAWMSYSKRQYYVALLSAASLHGAAHQQPQEFQVMVDKTLPPSIVGKLYIHYFKKNNVSETPIQKIKTNTGYIKVSTPEATAFDLIQYMKGSGNLGNVATVLSELSEKLDPYILVETAEKMHAELSSAQKLGFILDKIGKKQITNPLNIWVLNKKPRYVLLCPGGEVELLEKNSKWKVLVNEVTEVDV
jgi:predicted transcriptional regulator of viral defense system